jgi:hypothetical protein
VEVNYIPVKQISTPENEIEFVTESRQLQIIVVL